MDIGIFEKAVSQFEEMGGLKLMISGGEPLIHSRFWELMEILPSYELRVVILSNGTLIDETDARKLSGLLMKYRSVSMGSIPMTFCEEKVRILDR